MPTLDRAIEAGGEGPPGLSPDDPRGGKPPFIVLLEPVETGGEASCPRFVGLMAEYGEPLSGPWYFVIPDHSLPPTETGDIGSFRSFIVGDAQMCCAFSRNVRSCAAILDLSTAIEL